MRSSPLPMAQLIAKAGHDGINAATVYRTLELFGRLQLISEAGLGRNRLFELNDTYHSHHHHITCTVCGAVTDFDSRLIERDLQVIGQQLGFDVRTHQLEVTGVCSACSRGGLADEVAS